MRDAALAKGYGSIAIMHPTAFSTFVARPSWPWLFPWSGSPCYPIKPRAGSRAEPGVPVPCYATRYRPGETNFTSPMYLSL